MNGILFFTASDDRTRGLWKSNGSELGTVKLKNIWEGVYSIFSSFFIPVNDTLFLNANDGLSGYELWRSDGTETGTMLVKDIKEGPGFSNPGSLININDILFFSADDGVNGTELWQSDGTEAGTILVKDINAGVGSSNPRNLTNVDGTLFFTANDGIHGEELWAIINNTPVAINDEYALSANSTLFVSSPGILINDTDPDGDLLSAVLNSDVSKGSLTFNNNGSFIYTPTSGYSGMDTFTYHNTDGEFDSEIATVELTIKNIGSENIPGDLDLDVDVDKDDLALLRGRFGQRASGLKDPFDMNKDGVINVLDFRQAIKFCTRPSCATL